jgi:hypothetical protein
MRALGFEALRYRGDRMFSLRIRLVLRSQGSGRLLLVISAGFRLVFLGIAAIILTALLLASSVPLFDRANTFPLFLWGICILASLYLERWIFDRRLNLFEQDVGLLFFYKRRRQNLDGLRRVLLNQYQRGYVKQPKRRRLLSRVFVTLGVEDEEGRIHKLDVASAVHLAEMRKNAERIARFCGIALEDTADTEQL